MKKGSGFFWVIFLIFLVITMMFVLKPKQIPNDPASIIIDTSNDSLAMNFTVIAPNGTVISPVYSIVSFNLQVYGDTKAKNVSYNQKLHDVFSQYDIIVFQEIRDVDGSAAKVLQSDFPSHTCVYSEPLGRSSSKEQYMICYNNKFGRLATYGVGNYSTFERPPMMVELYYQNGSRLWVLDMHLKPEAALEELTALNSFTYGLPTIIAGDGNLDCSYFNHYQHQNLFNTSWWSIGDAEDTTQSQTTDCAYDRFLVNFPANISAPHGVLTSVQGMSDHYAIYMVIQE